MSGRLAGKKALLTAAAQGIGKACAVSYASEGAEVLATDINQEALDALAAEVPGVRVAKLDVRSGDAINALAEAEGAFDVLLNCAGYVHHGTILDCSDKDWEFSFDLNVTSMFRLTKALLPAMIESGGAAIVNMASVASSIRGVPNRFAYGASKAAIIGFSKAVAADFVGQGIRCNVICPGTVQSPSLDERIKAQGNYEETMKAFVARQPMGRIGTPEEIASLAVYLASDESAYTTGAVHVIDGGWCI